MEYLRFDEKIRLSLKINSLSFSRSNAPLKNSSLDAKKGLNLIPVLVLKLRVFSLSYISSEFFSKVSSISDMARRSAI